MRSQEEVEKELSFIQGCVQNQEDKIDEARAKIEQHQKEIAIYKWILEL